MKYSRQNFVKIVFAQKDGIYNLPNGQNKGVSYLKAKLNVTYPHLSI